ncbi:DNA primase [Clostridium cavendishii DSM 21758]|uniref:DNA primase n=1 Tax=Clostridium cavendishii DSM 21758 TaxID=1121302 RepID=A0A1M6AKR6_9CLOT|nr:DNA primase [Clostridium cavendishii]SHI37104.1 DNA primase [Clostridium cavendishii DSM 21758]
MQIPEDILEKIKEQNDIVDVISDSLRLKKSGRNFWGLCPFHNEKSPSFSVSQDKQIYKCFGCGEAGNVITFVMKTKNLPFIDSAKYLADRANIPLELDGNKKNPISKKREIFYNLNVEVARFFFANLYKNKVAKEYFLRRGITEGTLKKFGLGYSLDNWHGLLNYLRKKGYRDDIIQEAGLAIKSEKGSIYDRFRNRVMFPVFDLRGKVIGFGGRVLDDSKPKYLNSPETLVFQKGTNLYGLNFAIKSNIQDRCLVVVEGYMDCISLHQYGITNVVASLGTALTINQARLIKRYADRVVISYDADLAGQIATLRGLEILTNAGLEVRVLTVPQGKDPDEFIRSNGKEAFLKLINTAVPLIDYRLNKAKEGIDFSNNEMLIKYGDRVTEILAQLNPIEKDVYLKKIAEETGIREQAFYDLLSRKMIINNKDSNNMNNKEENGTKLYVEPAYLKAERSILKLMLNEENFAYIKEHISLDDLIMREHKEIYSIVDKLVSEENSRFNIKSVELKIQDPGTFKEWIEIKELSVVKGELSIDVLILDYINKIKKYKLEKIKKNILSKLKFCESKGEFEESLKLVKEAKDIDAKLKRLERG